MHFEVVHEFEAPLDALELAILSPHLIDKLGPRLPNVEKVTQVEHRVEGGRMRRVWTYQPNIKIPSFARGHMTAEMCAWQEQSTYTTKTHSSEWVITPAKKPEWTKYLRASGTYSLVASDGGTTKRVVVGEVELSVPPLVKQVAERMIVNEVKKTFEAEAATLRDLATLV